MSRIFLNCAPIMRILAAAVLLLTTMIAFAEDPGRGIPFGASWETIKSGEVALGSTIGHRWHSSASELTPTQREELERGMTKLNYLSFIGKGFGRRVEISYKIDNSQWSQVVTFFPANQAEMESFIADVTSALRAKYGKPSFSPENVGFLERTLISLFKRNEYLVRTNYYKWSLPGKDIVLVPFSYPGLVPDEVIYPNPRVHEPKKDVGWEVFYTMYGNAKETH